MACTGIISADVLFDCDNSSIAGLETDVVLINEDDIDYSASTIDGTNKLLMTNLQLKSGKTGYLLQGVKQINSTAWELVKKATGPDKMKHIFNGFVLSPNVANKLQLQNMADGGRFVVVVNKKWKGASNEEAFEILGFNSGLTLNVATYNSAENDGAYSIELSSEEGYEEPKLPMTVLETDYDATLTAFGNKFVQA